jgi:ligand-binding sensor domain-containing protein
MLNKLLLFLALFPVAAECQNHVFTRYGTSNGLLDNSITAIAQDKRGFLWVGTEKGGLYRFDGRSFIRYGLNNAGIPPGIRAVATNGDNVLVAASASGMYSLRLDSSCTDRPDSGLNRALSRCGRPVRSLSCDVNGTIRLITDDGAMLFDPAKRSLTAAVTGWTPETGLLGRYPGYQIRGSALDGKKRRWIATNRGLILSANAGEAVIGNANGLPCEDIRCVLCDTEGNVWCGTSDGLFRYTPDRCMTYLPGAGLPKSTGVLRSITTAPDGAVWFATSTGAIRLKDRWVTTLKHRDGLPSEDVRCVLVRGPEQMLFGTAAGLTLIDQGQSRTMVSAGGIDLTGITCLLESRRGGFWIGTTNGLIYWENDRQHVFTTAQGLPSSFIRAIAEDAHGDLWIGTDNGVSTIPRMTLDRARVLVALAGIPVLSVFVDHANRPWFGTAGEGVYSFQDGAVLRITHDDGLNGNAVVFIAEDAHHTLYFGTNAGVTSLPESNIGLFHPIDSTLYPYRQPVSSLLPFLRAASMYPISIAQGLPSNELLSQAVSLGSDGVLWFGTRGGAVAYSPMPPSPPGGWWPEGSSRRSPIHSVFLHRLQLGERELSVRNALSLDSDDRVLGVQCLFPSYRNPGQVRFLYQVEGMEYTWHESTDGRILLTGFRPGNYTLVVRATAGEGIWTAQHALLAITVLHPFHETGWFWYLSIFTAAVAGYFIRRFSATASFRR